MKAFITTVIVILLILLSLGALFGFSLLIKDDKDICLDSGICSEGQVINTEHGKIEINQENCLKYNWTWNAERKYCNLR